MSESIYFVLLCLRLCDCVLVYLIKIKSMTREILSCKTRLKGFHLLAIGFWLESTFLLCSASAKRRKVITSARMLTQDFITESTLKREET